MAAAPGSVRCLGIDLGTTNTVAAIDGKVVSIGEHGSSILPSVVGFTPKGTIEVGADARWRRTIDPVNTVYSAKRVIGRSWFSQEAARFKERYPFELEERDDRVGFCTRAGVFTPLEIAAQVLRQVAGHPQVAAVLPEAQVVIAVPSKFGDEQRAATIQAGHQAGFEHVATVDEPAAAAAAYIEKLKKRVDRGVVYDFGGGTFDVALISCAQEPFEVLGVQGDLYLGGDDVDFCLARWVSEQVLEKHGWDLSADAETFARLLAECEQVKIRLGAKGLDSVDPAQIDRAAPAKIDVVTIERLAVDQLSQGLVGRTFLLCDRLLGEAGVRAQDLDAVFVAGGATLMPLIREGVEKYFNKKVAFPFDPMEVVAIGASLSKISDYPVNPSPNC